MAATPEQRKRVLAFYDAVSRWLKGAVASLVADPDDVLTSARERFDALIDELPYLDQPKHTMAPSMFSCAAQLAVFEVLREREIDAHAWGRAIHTLPVGLPKEKDTEDARERASVAADAARERTRADAESSQSSAAANEFVFEHLPGDEQSDSGMNVKSCAICHLFGRHDAMELVPYMCSFDDVVSDARGQGLRRTGTIALGAKQCDFRFKQDGEPKRLAAQYPDRIRLTATPQGDET